MKIEIVNRSSNPLPQYKHEGDSGFDLMASMGEKEEIHIYPKNSDIINTGLFVKIPEGYEIQIRSRSGLAAKVNVFVLNAPGTIDASYRGELKIIVTNLGETLFKIKNGDRIAQGVLCPIIKAEFEQVESLDETDRNENGIGSTGV